MQLSTSLRSHLGWKIGSWLMLVFLLVVYVGWHMLNDIRQLHQSAQLIESVNHESHRLHELEMALIHTVRPIRSFLVSGDWHQPDIFSRNQAVLQKKLIREGLDQALAKKIKQASIDIVLRAKHIFSLPFSVGNLEGPILMREIDRVLDDVSKQLSVQHHRLDQSVNQSMRMEAAMRLDMQNDFMLSMLLLFLLLTGLTIWLYLHMVRPLVCLRHEMKKIGDGDFHIHCPELPKDELGELASACNMMGEALEAREVMLNHAQNMAAHHEKMRALGLMAAGIAHEVGNPLSGASVALETALRKLNKGQGEAAAARVKMAMSELSRTETIIRDILDYGKTGNESDLASIHVETVAQSAVTLAQMSPRRNHMKINTIFRASPAQVIANASMLRQVLVNLLLNAIDACEEKDGVELITENIDGGIGIHVHDHGSGIPPEFQGDIFKPMFTTKQMDSGSGIGLAISRELMERMHGRLELMRSDQHGSHFCAWLPS